MFATENIQQTPNDLPGVLSFRISGKVDYTDMEEMSRFVNGEFDARDRLDMLLTFSSDAGSTAGASLSAEAIKAQLRAIKHVRNYVVAAAPDAARKMIETWDAVLPVKAKTFDTEAEALDFLRAQPAPGA